MKRITTIALAFIVLILGACNLGEDKSRNIPEINLDEKSSQLIRAGNEFGLEIFKQIASGEEENILISPLSISVALAMAYNGADGDTRTEMEQTLKVAGLTTEQINDSYEYLIDALQSLDEKPKYRGWIFLLLKPWRRSMPGCRTKPTKRSERYWMH